MAKCQLDQLSEIYFLLPFTIFVIPKIVEYFQNWMAMKNWRMEEYLGNKYKLNLPI